MLVGAVGFVPPTAGSVSATATDGGCLVIQAELPPLAEDACSQDGCLWIDDTQVPPKVHVDPSCVPNSLEVDAIAGASDVKVRWDGNASALTDATHFVVTSGSDPLTAEPIGTVDLSEPWEFEAPTHPTSGDLWYGVQAVTADGEVVAQGGTYIDQGFV